MIIIYDKEKLIENIIEITNLVIDQAVTSISENPSKCYLSEYYASWINRQLIVANYEVRKILLHLLEDSDDNEESLIFDLRVTHPIQPKIFPQLIEEALIYLISDSWCTEQKVAIVGKSALLLSELKSISLKRESNRGREYRIIY